MRGTLNLQTTMLSSFSTEDLIPPDHPIRRIRAVVDVVLADLDPEFTAMYSEVGRPSIPPEQLLKATILQAMFSVRSVRAFCERLRYDMLFKWFLDLNVDDPAMDASTFSKNQERLLASEIADRFFAAVVKQARLRKYVSSEHFSADGTLLDAWASHKSFRPKKDGIQGRPAQAAETRRRTSTARSGRMRRMNLRLIQKQRWQKRVMGRVPAFHTWATRLWRTGTL